MHLRDNAPIISFKIIVLSTSYLWGNYYYFVYGGAVLADWKFYGRTESLTQLHKIVHAGRWFFCCIEGRRRVGKTTLLAQLAKQDPRLTERLIYMQVPDSDERDVAGALKRSLADCEHPLAQSLRPTVVNFPSMAHAIGELCRAGPVVVLDEFRTEWLSLISS